MNVHFDCTKCGKCCHDLKLPLSVDEAIAWTERGHPVHLLAEALPWLGEPSADDARAIHDRDRTFTATSGDIPVRIGVMLVAWHQGPCPYLLPDNRCGQYEERPRVCRIYPLPTRPFEALDIAKRLCPPEAWTHDLPVLMADDIVADAQSARIVDDHRRSVIDDVMALNAVCDRLGWSQAGFANEGFAVLAPDAADLATALRHARDHAVPAPRSWTILTNRTSTLCMLQSAGCDTALISKGADYLGSFSDEP